MAWNNATAQRCKAVYDVLAKIEKNAGVELPGDKKADDFLGSTAGAILDFGQQVYDDVELWSRMPLMFDLRSGSTSKAKLRGWLGRVLDECR